MARFERRICFLGVAGLSLGVREATVAIGKKFESAFALDIDETSLTVYKKNFNPVHALNEDIWLVLTGKVGDPLQLEERLLKKIGGVDVCLAGPPCQGHSDLNNHTRRDDKRTASTSVSQDLLKLHAQATS